MTSHNELWMLSIDQVENICIGLSLIPSKTLEQRELYGEMCQLFERMVKEEAKSRQDCSAESPVIT